MAALSRPLALASLLLVGVIVGACGSNAPASPAASGVPASGAPSSADPSSSAAPSAGPTTTAPTVAGFWTAAAQALAKSGRLRVVLSGSGKGELRFEPKASGVITNGDLSSACVSGAAYTIKGMTSKQVPGNWACGGSAFTSSYRRSGQPAFAWNSKMATDTKIKERVSATKDRWQWDYVATNKSLGGTVKTTLVMDPTSGRLISGTRTDPKGTTRYSFSYTTIFAPIALP